MSDRWATFDCYGTLIDWEGGVRATMVDLWPDAPADALVARYHQIEPTLQAGTGTPYRRVMADALAGVAAAEELTLPAGREDALGQALPGWRVFPEVREALTALRADGWRLAILSNTDPDFLDASIQTIGVPIDLRVVASAIGSYKPAPGHWDTFRAQSGAERARHVHVAASLFHDIEPCARMGIAAVWIDRLGETSDLPRAATLPDLSDLADTLGSLVPA